MLRRIASLLLVLAALVVAPIASSSPVLSPGTF